MFGEAMRRARERAGISREQLAVDHCRSVATIIRWEKNVNLPSFAVRARLARDLNEPALLREDSEGK